MRTFEFNPVAPRSLDLDLITAQRILAEVMKYRRTTGEHSSCDGAACPSCSGRHLPKILQAVREKRPVSFVLPAFPGKSPNLAKVLGPLPDFAEKLSLGFLGHLCNEIRGFYEPGMKMIVCSDGRVFSDVVGMKEEDVSSYQAEIARLIREMSLTDLSTFDLDDHDSSLEFVRMREELMHHYGKSLEDLKSRVRRGATPDGSPEEQEATRMYRGITRFLFEDSLHVGQTRSRTSLQNEARVKAYEVIRRSNAWSELIAERFPEAVRLSIHPQACGSAKLGLRLIGDESWMTPWHGVAVETDAGFILLKRSEAEALGAELVLSADGQPSHFRLRGASTASMAEVI